MDLVLCIGKLLLKGAFFENDAVQRSFAFPIHIEKLRAELGNLSPKRILIASENPSFEKDARSLFESLKLPFPLLDIKQTKIQTEGETLGLNQVANAYGALSHFPQNDCISVDINQVVTFDYIGKEGRYAGGAIYASGDGELKRPENPLGKSRETQSQSGLYYGLLGAVERIVDELRQTSSSPSSIKVLATGGLPLPEDFLKDLSDLVDLIDPQLTMIGFHEILKEQGEPYVH